MSVVEVVPVPVVVVAPALGLPVSVWVEVD